MHTDTSARKRKCALSRKVVCMGVVVGWVTGGVVTSEKLEEEGLQTYEILQSVVLETNSVYVNVFCFSSSVCRSVCLASSFSLSSP